MNKTSHYLKTIVLSLVAVLAMASCTDDDTQQAYDLNGYWMGSIQGDYYSDRYGGYDTWDTEIWFVQDGDFSNGGYGREIDYYRATGLQKPRQSMFRAVDSTPEIHIHKSLYHGEVQVAEHRPHGKTGIVHQDVYPAEPLHCLVYKVLAVRFDRDVGPDVKDFRLGRQFLRYFRELVGRPCGKGKFRSAGSE